MKLPDFEDLVPAFERLSDKHLGKVLLAVDPGASLNADPTSQ